MTRCSRSPITALPPASRACDSCGRFRRELRLPGSAKDWERVFVNLFLNAAQIMQKPGRIDIAAERSGRFADHHRLRQRPRHPRRDSAAHVSPECFNQNQPVARSGLGLHIVASIVKKYSGRVTAANRERGTERFLPFLCRKLMRIVNIAAVRYAIYYYASMISAVNAYE